jgi:hypothetical protein
MESISGRGCAHWQVGGVSGGAETRWSNSTRKDSMLKTRITEQSGLEVPFINAAMAFIATAPLVRAVCNRHAVSAAPLL